MKTFTNFTELFEAVEKANGQMNLEILLNRRANFGDFIMEEDEFRNQINTIVDEVLKGWQKYKYTLKYQLNNAPLSHWGFSRIIYMGGRWRYVAGQDEQYELNQIREFIRKN